MAKRRKKVKKSKKIYKKKVKKSKKIFKRKVRKKSLKKIAHKELIFKVPKKWSNRAYVNKSAYEKNINFLLKIMMVFGKKRVNVLIG